MFETLDVDTSEIPLSDSTRISTNQSHRSSMALADDFDGDSIFGNLSTNGDPRPSITFRYVDQSTEETQRQMEDYVNDLVDSDEISEQPSLFWLGDFQVFLTNNTDAVNLTINEQVALFLDHPVHSYLYREDIARNKSGYVTASRTYKKMDQIGSSLVTAQMDVLADQEAVSTSQPIYQGAGGQDWRFFTLADESFFLGILRKLPLGTSTYQNLWSGLYHIDINCCSPTLDCCLLYHSNDHHSIH